MMKSTLVYLAGNEKRILTRSREDAKKMMQQCLVKHKSTFLRAFASSREKILLRFSRNFVKLNHIDHTRKTK
jgi:hypothetical protein